MSLSKMIKEASDVYSELEGGRIIPGGDDYYDNPLTAGLVTGGALGAIGLGSKLFGDKKARPLYDAMDGMIIGMSMPGFRQGSPLSAVTGGLGLANYISRHMHREEEEDGS